MNSVALQNCVHQYESSPCRSSPMYAITNWTVDNKCDGLACKID